MRIGTITDTTAQGSAEKAPLFMCTRVGTMETTLKKNALHTSFALLYYMQVKQ
jgi:hypothetical protein